MKTIARAVALFAIAHSCVAAPICVGDSASLNQAFWTASNDEDATEIRIKAGTYSAPVGGWHYLPSPFDRFEDFTISGGWQGDCSSQLFDSTLTRLSGSNSRRILTMNRGQGNTGTIRLSRLSLVNAFSSQQLNFDSLGVALQILAEEHTGSIEVEHIIVRDNLSVFGNHVVYVAHAGPFKFRNNLVADNEAGSGTIGVGIDSIADHPYVTSNTIVNNTVLSEPATVLGLNFGINSGLRYVTNNIIWGNRYGSDVRNFKATFLDLLDRNNVGVMTGAPAAGSSMTYSFEPGFVSASDFRLTAASELHNIGAVAPWGGQSPFDLAGQNRVQNGIVDIGAFETPGNKLFKNGFD